MTHKEKMKEREIVKIMEKKGMQERLNMSVQVKGTNKQYSALSSIFFQI